MNQRPGEARRNNLCFVSLVRIIFDIIIAGNEDVQTHVRSEYSIQF